MPEFGPVTSPADEIDARRKSAGATLANGVLTEDMAAFCESGIGIVVASRDADGLAGACRAGAAAGSTPGPGAGDPAQRSAPVLAGLAAGRPWR